MAQQLAISQNELVHINQGRKRKIHIDQWERKATKLKKDSGEAYASARGVQKPAKVAPPVIVPCAPNCNKPGCGLPHLRRTKIFGDFWETASYNLQSEILGGLLDIVNVKQRTTGNPSRRHHSYKFHLRDDQGRKLETCARNFILTFGITNDRMRTIKQKLLLGKGNLSDQRGTNTVPRQVDPTLETRILAHIDRFPRRLSHYSRQAGNPLREYLDPNLSVAKMYGLFAVEEGFGNEFEWLYRRVFRDQPLRIGTPRSDTCDLCDRLFNRMSALDVNIPNEFLQRQAISAELEAHQANSEVSYAELQLDSSLADSNDYVVLAVDLQAATHLPELTNGQHYYRRKYAMYNLGIYNAGTKNTTMCIWTQEDGSRGACEIASCILKFCRARYQPLVGTAARHLIVYSDRCGGQNNNFVTVCVYRRLISERLFTSINQKFLVSGHSFLPCDRQFAVLENAKKKTTLIQPTDFEAMIRTACPKKPFLIQKMYRHDFINFQPLIAACPWPRSLRISQVLSIEVDAIDLNAIKTKENHAITVWTTHASPLRRNLRNVNLLPLRSAKIPITSELLRDLRASYQYIPVASRAFWQFLSQP